MGAQFISAFKKKARAQGSRIVYEDEAGFRQDPTLHRTWSRIGEQPQVAQLKKRSGIKVLESRSYIAFLETTVSQFFENGHPIFYIQDNASYHKDGDVWYWFKENRKWIEVFNLPPYCPELNATERLWKYTRKQTTHNRYFDTLDLLQGNLSDLFDQIMCALFCDTDVK